MKEQAALGAYKTTLRATGDVKAVEAAVFAHANLALSQSMQTREMDWPGYVAALSNNLQLWTTVAADVMSPGNKLPDQTRGHILALEKFVRSRTLQIFQGAANSDATALIDINANIASGLRGTDQPN